jgi:hypothetical protein
MFLNLAKPSPHFRKLRSICALFVCFNAAFCGLGCHPLTCMLLKLRFIVDSIPSALTILFIDLPPTKPARKRFFEVSQKRQPSESTGSVLICACDAYNDAD